MNRRSFIGNTIGAGIGVTLGTSASTAAPARMRSSPAARDPLVDKAMRAMLAMQRLEWEQGVAAQALLEMGERDWTILLAKEAAHRAGPDGRLAIMTDRAGVTDPGSNGEAVLFAAKETGDPALRAAFERMVDYLATKAPRTADGTIHHILEKPQVWIDSMYMGPPCLAVGGRFAEAVKQVEGIRRLLWNPKAKLFSQIWDDGTKTFAQPKFWGVGNGWAAAGMTRVAAALPDAHAADRTRIRGYVVETLDGCLAHRRPDGLFHNMVDEPATFIETNLSQIMAYVIYRGVREGWLGRNYLREAEVMRSAARAKVDEWGLVQGVCGAPDFEHPGTATEGQAFFLLMEAEAAKSAPA